MEIITIQFPNSTKKYDYFLENPENIDLSHKKTGNFVRGLFSKGEEKTKIKIVGIRKEECLPSYVTRSLRTYKDFSFVSGSIPRETISESQNRKKSLITWNLGPSEELGQLCRDLLRHYPF